MSTCIIWTVALQSRNIQFSYLLAAAGSAETSLSLLLLAELTVLLWDPELEAAAAAVAAMVAEVTYCCIKITDASIRVWMFLKHCNLASTPRLPASSICRNSSTDNPLQFWGGNGGVVNPSKDKIQNSTIGIQFRLWTIVQADDCQLKTIFLKPTAYELEINLPGIKDGIGGIIKGNGNWRANAEPSMKGLPVVGWLLPRSVCDLDVCGCWDCCCCDCGGLGTSPVSETQIGKKSEYITGVWTIAKIIRLTRYVRLLKIRIRYRWREKGRLPRRKSEQWRHSVILWRHRLWLRRRCSVSSTRTIWSGTKHIQPTSWTSLMPLKPGTQTRHVEYVITWKFFGSWNITMRLERIWQRPDDTPVLRSSFITYQLAFLHGI